MAYKLLPSLLEGACLGEERSDANIKRSALELVAGTTHGRRIGRLQLAAERHRRHRRRGRKSARSGSRLCRRARARAAKATVRKESAMSNIVLSADTLTGDKVVNAAGEDLGKIEDFMLDVESGRIRYAVLSFGGVLGLGSKLFAVPPEALTVDMD